MDMMNLFHGESGPFGLFDVHGVPEKNYYALRTFAEFLKTPRRVSALYFPSLETAMHLRQNHPRSALNRL